MAVKWVLESDLIFLEPAVRFAHLSPNAIREYAGDTKIGALAYPAPFCQHSSDWMRALSHIVGRNRDYSLYLVKVSSDNDRKELSRTRIVPTLDTETLDLLRQINQSETNELASQSKRITAAMERLRERAKFALTDDLSELYDPDQHDLDLQK
jgi:membrane-bound ClpP family serine protease